MSKPRIISGLVTIAQWFGVKWRAMSINSSFTRTEYAFAPAFLRQKSTSVSLHQMSRAHVFLLGSKNSSLVISSSLPSGSKLRGIFESITLNPSYSRRCYSKPLCIPASVAVIPKTPQHDGMSIRSSSRCLSASSRISRSLFVILFIISLTLTTRWTGFYKLSFSLSYKYMSWLSNS